MTYELRLQRVLDAPPEIVFDTFVDPDVTEELLTPPELPGFRVLESDIDLRVGGTWTIVQEGPDGERYHLTYVFTEVDRPHRLAASFTMRYSRSGRSESSDVLLTLEERKGKTLLTLVQSGFPTEEERDAYLSGTPAFLDAVARAVSSRVAR
ncbi:MAG TPA: SRPBCC domain-containing protein [Actinomycetota bacterium]|nr:SRPBCC domain-containing protein [Actinomycetota bacterium]